MSYETETFESFVQDVATAEARKYDARLSDEAAVHLVSVASRALRTHQESDLLEKRRNEIQRNIEQLVAFIVNDFPGYDRSGVISYKTLNDALANFCRRYPDAYPICPYP